MVDRKGSMASARASKTRTISSGSGSIGGSGYKTGKRAQTNKVSQLAKTGTSAKRSTRSARTGKDNAKAVNASAIATPRVRVERLQAAERAKLRELDALVAGGQDLEIVVVVGDDRVSLPRTVLEGLTTLGKVFEALDRGPSVTVVADDDQTELTSQQAADLLNVSRPHVIKLARDGVLAHHRVGNRHRFTLADVLDHRDQMRLVREQALAELAPADGYTAADF